MDHGRMNDTASKMAVENGGSSGLVDRSSSRMIGPNVSAGSSRKLLYRETKVG